MANVHWLGGVLRVVRSGGFGAARRAAALTVALVAAVLAIGCESVGKYDIAIELDRAWAASGSVPALEVDLVALGETEAATLENYTLSDYFRANDSYRRSLPRYTVRFSSTNTETKTLPKSDPIWNEWGTSATELFVLVNLPGIADQPGSLDPRRLILPRETGRWPDRSFKVLIQEGRVTSIPSPLPPEN